MPTPDLERLISSLLWPWDRLAEAIALVARQYRFGDARRAPDLTSASSDVEAMAGAAGIEAEGVRMLYRNIETTLATSAPMLIRALDADGFLLVLRNRRRAIVLAGPLGQMVRIPREEFASIFQRPVESSRGAVLQRFLERVRSGRGGHDLHRRLIAERYGDDEVAETWLLRRSLHEGFWRHLSDAGAGVSAFALAATHLFRYIIFVLSWLVIGRVAIEGRPDGPWLIAWMLLLLMCVPIHYIAMSLQGVIALAGGFVLRQRLLYGCVRLDPERLRMDGAGRHLARVFEGDAVEALGRSGGFLALFSVIELVLCAAILARGAGGMLHVFLLAAWIAFIIAITVVSHRRYDAWSLERLSLSADLVERMVGHRTRLVQEPRCEWHEHEDAQLESYAHASRHLDRALLWISAITSRGWIALALAGLAPSIVGGETPASALAISLGGIVLAQQAMKRLSVGLPDLIAAFSAWKKVAPLLEAASRPLEPHAIVGRRQPNGNRNVADVQTVVFRYPHRAEPVLRGCTLRIEHGERVVLEGRSGSGKSTLASLLAGARSPDSGLLMLDGLDRATLGSAGWRRRAVLAPQFHENHVFSESLAFNLLMGRAWPPTPQDWREAEEICIDLGLGALLEQMPGGLSQMVGETGWRLSHGEQSRLFIARALLQKSELVILDESFAALDPETLQRSIDCVVRRAPSLVVIAHP